MNAIAIPVASVSMNSQKITNLATPTLSSDAATKDYIDASNNSKLPLTGGTMSGAIVMGTNKITEL